MRYQIILMILLDYFGVFMNFFILYYVDFILFIIHYVALILFMMYSLDLMIFMLYILWIRFVHDILYHSLQVTIKQKR